MAAFGASSPSSSLSDVSVASSSSLSSSSPATTVPASSSFASLSAALCKAAEANDGRRIVALLSNTSDSAALIQSARNDYGDHALHLAAARGHEEVVQILLKAGAAPDVRHTKAGYTPLHKACWSGSTSVVDTLLRAGASISAVDKDHYSPLHWAAWGGKLQCVQQLIDSRAAVNAIDRFGFTPLHRACLDRHLLVIALLLKHGADPNITNEDGESALHIAARADQMDAVVLLVRHGAESTLVANNGLTPIQNAKSPELRAYLESFKNMEAPRSRAVRASVMSVHASRPTESLENNKLQTTARDIPRRGGNNGNRYSMMFSNSDAQQMSSSFNAPMSSVHRLTEAGDAFGATAASLPVTSTLANTSQRAPFLSMRTNTTDPQFFAGKTELPLAPHLAQSPAITNGTAALSSATMTSSSSVSPTLSTPSPTSSGSRVTSWTLEDVRAWLGKIGLRRFADDFEENEIDGEGLLLLEEKDLYILLPDDAARGRFVQALAALVQMPSPV